MKLLFLLFLTCSNMDKIAVVDSNSYLTERVVILRRWCVCVGKHKTVGQGKIVNPQICKRHPILRKNDNNK